MLTHGQMYGTRWQKARAAFLAHHPLCVMCAADNRVCEAVIVDHIIPHKGDMKLFWDKANWQSLCKPHHDATKQKQERNDVIIGCDIRGIPNHWK